MRPEPGNRTRLKQRHRTAKRARIERNAKRPAGQPAKKLTKRHRKTERK
ncbi:hypothetical protein QFZ24_007253 [Streptomyces phaeochromogenes]|nr:hypothetical protein [Streptomyces phaeochromogenes]